MVEIDGKNFVSYCRGGGIYRGFLRDQDLRGRSSNRIVHVEESNTERPQLDKSRCTLAKSKRSIRDETKTPLTTLANHVHIISYRLTIGPVSTASHRAFSA
jgi:hypothetical protein